MPFYRKTLQLGVASGTGFLNPDMFTRLGDFTTVSPDSAAVLIEACEKKNAPARPRAGGGRGAGDTAARTTYGSGWHPLLALPSDAIHFHATCSSGGVIWVCGVLGRVGASRPRLVYFPKLPRDRTDSPIRRHTHMDGTMDGWAE